VDKAVKNALIKRYSSEGGLVELEDLMVVEQGIEIWLNGELYRKVYCSPIYVDELVIGSLAFDHIINSIEDIKSFNMEADRVYVSLIKEKQSDVHKACKPVAGIRVHAHDITRLMKLHLDSSYIHKQTGGVHIMSLSQGQNLLLSREDVGRHNAVDKLYGYCLKKKLDCSSMIFLSSGRISNEIIEKIIYMGIKLVVARATVTSLAQRKALQAGITLIGFARGERFNIYSHPEAIITGNCR
jgi:FdhD protein